MQYYFFFWLALMLCINPIVASEDKYKMEKNTYFTYAICRDDLVFSRCINYC